MLGHESHFEISGRNDAEKVRAEERLRNNRQQQERRLEQFEIPETPKDRKIIDRVEDAVDAEIRQYGGNPTPIPREQVHIVRPGSLASLQAGRFKHGFAILLEQYVVIERGRSDTAFALHLAHELFHLKSPKVTKLFNGNGEPRLYRSGISMIDFKSHGAAPGYERLYFGQLEEALVAQATDQVFRHLALTNEFVKAEVALFARVRPWLRKLLARAKRTSEEDEKMIDAFRAIPTKNVMELLQALEADDLTGDQKLVFLYNNLRKLHKAGAICEAERTDEREKLDALVDDLVAHSHGTMTRKQIMAKLLEANFSGNYLAVARMIEGAMGKGAFRRVAEDFSEPEHAA
jgi:hypothetical protein